MELKFYDFVFHFYLAYLQNNKLFCQWMPLFLNLTQWDQGPAPEWAQCNCPLNKYGTACILYKFLKLIDTIQDREVRFFDCESSQASRGYIWFIPKFEGLFTLRCSGKRQSFYCEYIANQFNCCSLIWIDLKTGVDC